MMRGIITMGGTRGVRRAGIRAAARMIWIAMGWTMTRTKPLRTRGGISFQMGRSVGRTATIVMHHLTTVVLEWLLEKALISTRAILEHIPPILEKSRYVKAVLGLPPPKRVLVVAEKAMAVGVGGLGGGGGGGGGGAGAKPPRGSANPTNPNGQRGNPDHQSAIAKLIDILKQIFRTPQYRVEGSISIKPWAGIDRRPDAVVIDNQTDSLVVVGEAARVNASGSAWVGREIAKESQYNALDIPNIFMRVK